MEKIETPFRSLLRFPCCLLIKKREQEGSTQCLFVAASPRISSWSQLPALFIASCWPKLALGAEIKIKQWL